MEPCTRKNFVIYLHLCLFYFVTEVTELSRKTYSYVGVDIGLPTLICHALHSGYKEVSWYKDQVLLEKGEANPEGEILDLFSLLSKSKQFQNPFKLQGYYWCETNYVNVSTAYKYLFRIKEIHTFVGRFISTKDSLGDAEKVKRIFKVNKKKLSYENDMQDVLFGFLPKPSVYVTDITIKRNGLEIRFYLYIHQPIQSRTLIEDDLVEDDHELKYILEYLNNKTEVDSLLYQQMQDWQKLKGIKIETLDLKSTLGCYPDITLVPGKPSREIVWNYAKINEIVIPEEACSTKDGLAVTRLCTGSFYSGARWGNPSGVCNIPATNLTTEIKFLYNSLSKTSRPTQSRYLKELTQNPGLLTVTDLHLTLNFLERFSESPEHNVADIDDVFSIINNIIKTNSTELIAAKNTIKLTTRTLQVIDNLLQPFDKQDKDILIIKQNLLLEIKDPKLDEDKEEHFVGITISHTKSPKETLKNSSVSLGTGFPLKNALAYFVLPEDLVIEREKDTPSPLKSLIKLVYFKDSTIFPSPKEALIKKGREVMPSPVIYISLTGGPAWNLKNPVDIFFRNVIQESVEKAVCVYYDPLMDDTNGGWSTEGCSYKGIKNGFYHCYCNHLSTFSIILIDNPITKSYHLGAALYTGCVISIIALSFAVILYMLSKHWRRTVDHSVLFWTSLSFFLTLIILVMSEKYGKSNCFAMSLFFNYAVLVTLGWVVVHAVMYRLRFGKKTNIEEIPYFILKCAICVWGLPIIITIIIWITRDVKVPDHISCIKTAVEISKAETFPIALVLLTTMCIYACAMYDVSCRYKTDYLLDNSSYKDVVIKFRVAFTIYLFFMLSYILGLLTVLKYSKELRIFFSICITLTAYYVTLFFVFHEESLWDMCRKWRRNPKKNEADTMKYEATKDTVASIPK